MEPLTAYEIARTPLAPLPPEARVAVPSEIREELRCMICYEILRDAKAVAECLHRFCRDCAELAVRKFAAVELDARQAPSSRRKASGGAECPLCRTNIASRRDLYDDPHFQSLVGVLYPHVEAAEAAEQRALDARASEYQRALAVQHRAAEPAGAAAAAATAAEAPEPENDADGGDGDDDGMMEPQDDPAEAERLASMRICFGLRPLPPEAAAPLLLRQQPTGKGKQQEEGVESLSLPSIGDRKLFRATAAAKVRDLKGLAARRLCLAQPGHLELCLLLSPSSAPPGEGGDGEPSSEESGGVVVVVLDDALTLAEVVTEVWGKAAGCGELIFHYCLRLRGGL